MQFEKEKLTVERCKDAGLALVLICLIVFFVWKLQIAVILGTVFLVAAMTYPLIFQPFAKIWFSFSIALGTVVSKVILTVLFYAMVCPVAAIRRIMGKDSMRLKAWKQGNHSVFRERGHQFTSEDLEHPY